MPVRSALPAPGVVDVIAFGVVLVLVGLAVLVVEAHVSTAGLLAVPGVMAAAAGIGLILAGLGAALVIAVPVAVALAALGLVAVAIMAHKVVAARNQPIRLGPSALLGATATVRVWSGEEGQVVADGTLWRARATWDWEGPPPALGEAVVVDALDGLTVSIRRRYPWEVAPVWTPSSLSS